ncbi:RidA family protein [Phaeobacter sp. C3_T13_0]|uniref:RidA family protein n=1 Tax=Phaeobacter cretensis TaxID=3342641 RepID=UPI0039BC4237
MKFALMAAALVSVALPKATLSEPSLKTAHNPPELVDSTQYGYSQAVSVPASARTIYVAGQVGQTVEGPNDFESQVDRSFANLMVALKAAGGAPENIVRITLLIKDYDPEKLAYIGKKRREVFGDSPPASVLIPVTRLYIDEVNFEISAVAVTR